MGSAPCRSLQRWRRPGAGISSSPRRTRRWPCASTIPDATLVVLGGLFAGAEPDYAAHGIIPALGSLAEIDAWSRLARRLDRALPALIHFDTGMSRLGLDARECAVLAQDHGRLAGIDVRYVMSHLVSAEAPGRSAERDPARSFRRRPRAAAPGAGEPGNSSGMFLGDGIRLRPRAARIGAVRDQPDADAEQSDAPCGAPDRARAGGAGNPGRRDGRLQRHLDGAAPQPHRDGRRRLRRWLAPHAFQHRRRRILTATPFRW